MRLNLSLIALSVLVAVPITAVSENQASAGQPSGTPVVKALASAAVEIDIASLAESAGPTVVDVAVVAGMTDTVVTMSATGAVEVDSTPQLVPMAPGDDSASVVVDVVGLTGAGTLTARLTGRDLDGMPVSASDTVWVDVVAGSRIVSEIGTQDLALRVVAELAEAGTESPSEIETQTELAKVGEPVDVGMSRAPAACASGSICVTGIAKWTDSVGGTHPIRRAYVEIVDSSSGTDVVVRTTSTNNTGAYSAQLATPVGSRDISVRLLAASPGFEIIYDADPIFNIVRYETQVIVSTTSNGVRAGTQIDIPFVANNVDDNHTAFSLHNAMLIAREYLPTMTSMPFSDVDVVFPGRGSFYDGVRLEILQADRWDWDVMLHEYGHFIADRLDIENNPGGRHSSNENLGNRLDKGVANRLAWGEGWPTYFAVSLLQEMGAAALNIPNVGDTRYQDTEDLAIDFDLESDLTRGEDNEATVMATLWDLYDGIDDGLDEVELGAQFIWDALDGGDPHTLSDAYSILAPFGGRRYDPVNCVFSQMNVAPRFDEPPVEASGATAPTLSWSMGNGGINGANDSFTLDFHNEANSVRLFTSGPITDTYYSVPTDVWPTVVAGGGGTVNVTVRGTETRLPVTGPYRSCARTFANAPPVDPPAGQLFTSIDPQRFADTRAAGETFDQRFVAAGPLGAGDKYEVEFAGRGGVPVDARAVIVNVTAIQPDAMGYVTAFDCTPPQPVVSSLNYVAGVNVANELVVTLGASGTACFYSSAVADLGVDVVGYVADDSLYVPVEPARLLETRTAGQRTIDGVSQGGGRTVSGGEISVMIAERAGVPSAATVAAVVVNVTAIGATESGFVTTHPCLGELPIAASLNYAPGTNRGNEIIAPLSPDGTICFHTSGSVDLNLDVVGYVPIGSNLERLEPARLLDTREGGFTIDGKSRGEGRRGADTQYTLQVTGRNGTPAGEVDAAIIYVTAVGPDGTGFVTVHPCEPELPMVSSLNHVDRVNGGNEIVAKLDPSGRLCLYTSNSTHLTVDLTGYLATDAKP